MSIYHVILLVIGFLYSVMTVLACISQYFFKKVTPVNNTVMLVGGVVLFTSLLLFLLDRREILIPVIVSLVIIHIAAILNGLYMYKKVNLSHHIVRFCISAVIIALYLIG